MSKAKTVQIKMAAAKPADVQRVIEFFQTIDEWMERATLPVIEGTTHADADAEESRPATESEFVQRLARLWGGRLHAGGVDCSWSRVVFGFQTLFDNAADPNSDVLEWKPEIAEKLADPPGMDEAVAMLAATGGNADEYRRMLQPAAIVQRMVAHALQNSSRGAGAIMGRTGDGRGIACGILHVYGPRDGGQS